MTNKIVLMARPKKATGTCAEPGCDRKAALQGYCDICYQRNYRRNRREQGLDRSSDQHRTLMRKAAWPKRLADEPPTVTRITETFIHFEHISGSTRVRRFCRLSPDLRPVGKLQSLPKTLAGDDLGWEILGRTLANTTPTPTDPFMEVLHGELGIGFKFG